MICVNCKREINGAPYNDEPWVGAFCSRECEDEIRRIRNKGDGESTFCGGRMWFEPGDNSPESVRAGRLNINVMSD